MIGLQGPKPVSAKDLADLYNDLGIPHFQRGLVWNQDLKGLLLESLYYGTPCGYIILWNARKPKTEGEHISGVEDQDFSQLIVDGQQRIYTLHEIWDEIHKPRNKDDKVWGIDLHVEGLASPNHYKRRERLFAFTDNLSFGARGEDKPKKSHVYSKNFVPLYELLDPQKGPERIWDEYDISSDDTRNPEDVIECIREVKKRVAQMWEDPLFTVATLHETEVGAHQSKEVVALYIRINSAGSRALTEEKAYAVLVQICEEEARGKLVEFYKEVHGDEKKSRSAILKREKENRFGFKLWLRTLALTCGDYFRLTPGSTSWSFDVIIKPTRHKWFEDKNNENERGRLFDRTLNALKVVRSVLDKDLNCDDLRMLSDVDCLIPVLQLLIQYPEFAEKCAREGSDTRSLVAYLILRTALDPARTQKSVFEIAKAINRSKDAKSCLEAIMFAKARELHLGDIDERKLKTQLNEAKGIQQRYVLLLYWLVRKNRAKDFSYKNLKKDELVWDDENGKERRVEASQELKVDAGNHPEKQHIVPAGILSTEVYGKGKRISSAEKHDVNDIGNLTYISAALNSGKGGLWNEWFNPEHETDHNLKAHLLERGGKALGHYSSNLGKYLAKNESLAKTEYDKFCAERRDLIQKAFVNWLRELRDRCKGALQEIGDIPPADRLPETASSQTRKSLTEDAFRAIAEDRDVKELFDQVMKLRNTFGGRVNFNLGSVSFSDKNQRVVMGVKKPESGNEGLVLYFTQRIYEFIDKNEFNNLVGSQEVLNSKGVYFDGERLKRLEEQLGTCCQ